MTAPRYSTVLPRVGLRRFPRARRARLGVTLLEVMVSLPILAVVAGMFSSTVVAMFRQRAVNRENSRAANALQSQIERLRNEGVANVFPLYNADPLDDPAGPGTAPGPTFEVPGLARLAAEPARPIGEVILPAAQSAAGVWELREDLDSPELGLPRDLNRDFVVDAKDHRADALAIPVIVRARWEGPFGPRQMDMFTLLIGYRTQ